MQNNLKNAEDFFSESFPKPVTIGELTLHQELLKKIPSVMVNYTKGCQLPMDSDKAWSTYHVIEKLVESADILLHKKDYDGHGWEEIEICYKRGKEILQQIKSKYQEGIEFNNDKSIKTK